MRTKRNYQAEYQRRIERGLAKGFTRSQARGHGKPKMKYDRRLEEGLKAVRKGESVSKAAKSIHAAPETLKSYIKQAGVGVKQGRRTRIGADFRPRDIPIYSEGRKYAIRVNDYETASRIGHYSNAVNEFLRTNNRSVLKEFEGESVVDASGKRYVFETRPNVLYKLDASSTESFEEVYRIVV